MRMRSWRITWHQKLRRIQTNNIMEKIKVSALHLLDATCVILLKPQYKCTSFLKANTITVNLQLLHYLNKKWTYWWYKQFSENRKKTLMENKWTVSSVSATTIKRVEKWHNLKTNYKLAVRYSCTSGKYLRYR